jgi:hypothetical protein
MPWERGRRALCVVLASAATIDARVDQSHLDSQFDEPPTNPEESSAKATKHLNSKSITAYMKPHSIINNCLHEATFYYQ